jgi:hypothetical protein
VDSKVFGNGNEIITKNFSNYSFSDSISNIFNQYLDTSKFSSTMPLKLFGAIKYQLNPKISVTLIDRYVYLKNLKSNSFALMADIDMTKELSVSTGYSVISNSYTNLPFAILFRKDFGQMYLGTDNLLAFIFPSISDFAGFSFGTCFYLFRKNKSARYNSQDYPFYQAKYAKRNPKTGLISNENNDL